jgi:TPR repeat protein
MVRNGLAGLALATMLATGAPVLAAQAAPSEPARTQLLRRAQAGDVAAYDLLADSYLNAKGGQRDVEAAVRWLNAGVKAGDTECMIALGNLYFEGEDLDQDEAKALSLYKAAAAKGDALGAYNAGLVYETSAEDLTQALSWYWRAAAGGDGGGMYKLALAYQLGRGVATNEAQAVAWMRKAAAAGSVDATNDLGSYYLQGYGVPVDETRALTLYVDAAQRGSAVAMANVAAAYHNGEGVAVDQEKALRLYALSAGSGNLTAFYDLGQMYEDGEGVKASRAKAVQLYRMAAESEDAEVSEAAEDAVERLESGSSETPIA